MLKNVVRMRQRSFLAAVALIAAGGFLAGPAAHAQLVGCFDNNGSPRPVVYEDEVGGDGLYTASVPVTELLQTTTTDLDVAVKIRAGNLDNMYLLLQRVKNTAGTLEVKTIPLYVNHACGSYPANTTFNMDLAVVFDDQAVASADLACDRGIPSITGRMSPSLSLIAPAEDAGLDTFNGDQSNCSYSLIIRSANKEPVDVIEACLIFDQGLEGDISPRENTPGAFNAQSGNAEVTIADYIDASFHLLGYYLLDRRLFGSAPIDTFEEYFFNDLDTYQNLADSSFYEFARLDNAPASSSGDGLISVADFVQSARYGDAVDAFAFSGGPIDATSRRLRFESATIPRGAVVGVPVVLNSRGAEREISFGVQFDPDVLEFVRAERGGCVPSNANFQLNNETANEDGQIGLQVALEPGKTFPCDFSPTAPVLSRASGAVSNALLLSDNTRSFQLGSITSTDPTTFVPTLYTKASAAAPPAGNEALDLVVAGNLSGSPITSYSAYITYDATVFTSISAADVSLGAAPALGPVVARNGNYETRLLNATNVGSALQNGTVARVTFGVATVSGRVSASGTSVVISSIPPRATDSEVAVFFFRAKPGTGAVATTLDFIDAAFNNGVIERRAKNPGSAPQSCEFSNASVTVLDNADARPTVRIVDTVLRSDTEGRVQLALDSVGIENAAGFTLNYNPADLELVSVDRGRDVPFEAFFYTLPNENNAPDANADGKVRFLIGLQPTKTFAPGTRILADLVFKTKAVADTTITPITFTPLYDRAEVVDPNAVPLTTRFADGQVAIAGAACDYTLTPPTNTFTTAGGTSTFGVTTTNGCNWVATASENWVTVVSGTSGIASGTVSYRVDPNNGAPRTATIDIVGEKHTIQQDGCEYALSPESLAFNSEGGSGTFQVTTTAECPYTISADASWIIVTSPSNNVGSGTVSFTVSPNVGLAREGTITLSSDAGSQTFTVRQLICAYAITPQASETISSSGGTGSFSLSTLDECPWKVTTTVPWITVTSATEGTGEATITYAVSPNIGATRTGNIVVGGEQYLVTQGALEGCEYSINPLAAIYNSTGGTGNVTLTTNPGCPWEVKLQSGIDWVTIDSPTTGTSTVTINYTVAPNSNDEARFATITLAGLAHTIQQFPADQYVFEFFSSAEGWTSGSVPGVFDAPTFTYAGGDTGGGNSGGLSLTTPNNTNTFGFWGSPLLALAEPTVAADLFRADFIVSAPSTPQSSVPVIRFRTSSEDFSRSDAYAVTSTGNGSFSPSSTGRQYTHLFQLPVGTSRFRTFFDVLSFDPTDAAVSTLTLQTVIIQPVEADQLSSARPEGSWFLGQSQTGWTPVTSTALAPASFSVNSRGLEIGSGFTGSGAAPTTFGFWSFNAPITLESPRLYGVTFQVSSRAQDSLEVRKSTVPTFRLRLNDSSLKSSVYVNVESIDDNSTVPTFTSPQQYTAWFRVPATLAGQTLSFALDYILTPGSFNDPKIALTLESVEVTSYTLAD